MTYDTLLLIGVAFIVSYVMLASLRWSYPMSPPQRMGLQAILFAALGAYLVICWTRTGQTLGVENLAS